MSILLKLEMIDAIVSSPDTGLEKIEKCVHNLTNEIRQMIEGRRVISERKVKCVYNNWMAQACTSLNYKFCEFRDTCGILKKGRDDKKA